MTDVLLLNKIAKIGLDILEKDKYNCAEGLENPGCVLVRSAAMHDMTLPDSLLAIARAGAGVNNIPIDKCSERGVIVFNTPGANANAVKELVVAGLLLSSRKIWQAIDWSKTLIGEGENVEKLVEKGKAQFVGPEIEHKKLGVIGLGAIGVMVANIAVDLGMDVIGYDPYISVDAAWGLARAVHKAKNLNEIFTGSDYITLHVPLNDETRGMINADSIAKMRDGVRILNFSRGELVDSSSIIAAVKNGMVACYVTDFPNEEQLSVENIITIPHLGASTPESEDNCAVMAAAELKEYIEEGNVINSVNFPNVSEPRETPVRVCVLHRNIPDMIRQFSSLFSEIGVNIHNFTNKSKKNLAYSILDVDMAPDYTAERISSIDGVIRVRVIGE